MVQRNILEKFHAKTEFGQKCRRSCLLLETGRITQNSSFRWPAPRRRLLAGAAAPKSCAALAHSVRVFLGRSFGPSPVGRRRSVRSARVCMCVSAALQPTLTGHRRPTSAHLSARLQSRQSGKTPLLCTGECDGGTAERPAVGGALAEWSGAVNETAANRWGKMRILRHFALGISNGDLRGRFVVGLGRAERRSLRRKSNLRDGDKLCSCLCGALAGLPNGLDTGKECAQLWRVSWS